MREKKDKFRIKPTFASGFDAVPKFCLKTGQGRIALKLVTLVAGHSAL